LAFLLAGLVRLGNARDAKLVLTAIVYFKVARQQSFTLFPVGLVETCAQHSGSFHKKAWEECSKVPVRGFAIEST
jgi:hypothetical protein